jgi:hypothetical protein
MRDRHRDDAERYERDGAEGSPDPPAPPWGLAVKDQRSVRDRAEARVAAKRQMEVQLHLHGLIVRPSLVTHARPPVYDPTFAAVGANSNRLMALFLQVRP